MKVDCVNSQLMEGKLHVMLVNNYTGRGGIPKAIAFLANGLSHRGHRVTIVSQRHVPKPLYQLYKAGCKIREFSLEPGKRPPLPLGFERLEDMYELDNGIRIIPYSFSDNNLKIQKLRKQIKNIDPDVCVCPLPDGSQIVWAVTLMGTGIPYIYSERSSPRTIENLFWTRKGRLAAMSGADAIHLLLPGYARSIPEFLRERVRIIPNVILIPKAAANAGNSGSSNNTLLWLGRLHEELKQCCMALDAFALLADKFPNWRMLVAGDGQDRRKIETHAIGLSLGDRIKFLGNVDNVWPVYAAAQAFCFSSRTEGMPNALLEAMASGLPCAGFTQCDGVPDIIEDGKTGLLVDKMTPEAMADRLAMLMESARLRQELGSNARKSMMRFSESVVFDAWENMLFETAKRKNHTMMDKFYEEPFASLARMSSRARQEWAGRDFKQPFPDALTPRICHLLHSGIESTFSLCSKLKKVVTPKI